MAGLCEGGNEPSGSLKAICKMSGLVSLSFVSCERSPGPQELSKEKELAEKKLSTQGYTGGNGERDKSSGKNKLSDDIKIVYGSCAETKRKAENSKD
ncbi:hypothetical protein ANN_06392 [Periplaneta americana]|uniref:Uncharacterized protein n=1 Tax=Periplaneta americana TaxID=6978 RepID=A0ABQ8TDF2_PERAM|nr:hypothetical protein ANN_06392 [Periplaneta americana]